MPAKKKVKKTAKKGSGSVSWSAPEFLVFERGPLWYFAGALFFLAAELLAVFVLRDVFTAVLLGVSALVILFHHRMEPRTLEYSVDEDSVQVGANEYHRAQLKSFWFSYDPQPLVHLEIKGRMMPISVILDELTEDELREALSKLTQEDDAKQEDFLSKLVRVLKL